MSIEDVAFTLKTVSSTRTAVVIGIIAAIGGPVATVQPVAEAAAASRRRTTFGLSRWTIAAKLGAIGMYVVGS